MIDYYVVSIFLIITCISTNISTSTGPSLIETEAEPWYIYFVILTLTLKMFILQVAGFNVSYSKNILPIIGVSLLK